MRNKVVYHLRKTLQALKIERAGLHAFRHAVASVLLDNGAPPSVVQRQMRHSDAWITLQKYAHIVGDAQRKAVESLAKNVFGD
jgi:integrase